MNINTRTHRREHTAGTFYPSINDLSAELSLYGRFSNDPNDTCLTNKPIPEKKSIPEVLKTFLQFIPGNNTCPDCEVRIGTSKFLNDSKNDFSSKDSCLPWAK